MQNFIEKTSKLTEKEIRELLYYYQQGINIGKEEMKVRIINNLYNLKFDLTTISKITNTPKKKIEQYIN